MASRDVRAPGSVESEASIEIDDVVLPEPVAELADQYERVVGDRDRYLWQWIYSLFPSFTLSSVDDDRRETVRTGKTILTMFVTLLDDLAEKHNDARTFEELRSSVYRPEATRGDRPGVDTEVFEFGRRLWQDVDRRIERAPRSDVFREIFEYDFRQSFNAMEYSRIVTENPRMANLRGVEHYGPHNMVMFPYADVDLMYSPGFDIDEYGELRELIWDLQKLARIGNWLTTWERELAEEDLTAGILVYALQHDVLSPEDLADADQRATIVERIRRHGIEERFVGEWWRRYHRIRNREFEAETVDLNAYVEGMETVLQYHLSSRGRK